MKRAVLVVGLLLTGVVAAQADVDHWTAMARHGSLPESSDACEQQVGRNLNGVPTSAQFKRCMARHGWRYAYTKREPTWVDPDTGLTCHNTGIATVCSNF